MQHRIWQTVKDVFTSVIGTKLMPSASPRIFNWSQRPTLSMPDRRNSMATGLHARRRHPTPHNNLARTGNSVGNNTRTEATQETLTKHGPPFYKLRRAQGQRREDVQ
ncbi:hypothetical protein C8F04DRAFT_1187667 [Mycena alexandri]|uniref:Uncharacterized protein n=1 Tax=Mycena alexandri TaxID=1745969 RepID=A0AAD6SNC7_9AGAR|nr:hypothetical protein C8F04DRAFT_1187667 [Mycena alexandri]